MRGIFVTGTDTDVGKTYVGTQLAEQLKAKGLKVIPKKPVESGCKKQDGELLPADALKLKQASNYTGDLSDVCAYRFEAALSPVRAAHLENINLSIAQLTNACRQSGDGFLLVEGAGGFYSPLADDGLNADLAEALQLPVLLVANDKLGCINQILLTTEAISNRGLILAAIVLNSIESNKTPEMNNAEDLRELITAPIFTLTDAQNNNEPLKKLRDYLLTL